MSAAVQSTLPAAPAKPLLPRPTPLLIASCVGGVFVVVSLLAAAFVSQFAAAWKSPFAIAAVVALYVAPLGLFAFLGSRVGGDKTPAGTRGGITLVVSFLIATYCVFQAVAANLSSMSYGIWIAAAVAVLALIGAYRFLLSDRGRGVSVTIEEQGWLHLHGYKRNQGLIVRRLTALGVLIIGGTGIWSLYSSLPTVDVFLHLPYAAASAITLPLLPAPQTLISVLLGLATLWVAWRLINVPQFADFLIATEAEMNKVSWSTRRKLIQDTIVVLVTCAVLTVFLLVIDLFWGWLLSQKFIGVLPEKKQNTQQVDVDGSRKLDW